jgi:diguanylate cyclase (GGDEF)-like protein/PAS domain S-box-containing protein
MPSKRTNPLFRANRLAHPGHSESHYRKLLEAAPDALIVVNEGGDIVLVNVQAEKQFGYLRDELLGQPLTNIIPEGFAGQLVIAGARSGAEMLSKQQDAGIELKGERKDGTCFPIEFTLSPVCSAQGLLMTFAIRDITARKQAEANLLQKVNELNQAQVTLNCIGDAVVCTDLMTNITFLNLAAETMTGWPLKEAWGRPLAEILNTGVSAGSDSSPNTAELAILENCAELVPTRCVLVRRDGIKIQIENSVAPIYDQNGHASGAVVVFRDTTAAQAMAQQITHAADHDWLTDLPNARLLSRRIASAIENAQHFGLRVAVLFLDLDGFKYINDSLGHSTGDLLLQSVAKRLVGCVRSCDTVSRQGGDEFVVLLPDVRRPDDPANLARRLLRSVAGVHSVDQQELHVTTSIGVSMFPDDGCDAEALIKNADTAMYQAKENGRQGFQLFEPVMNARAVERQSIEEALRCALDRREFSLHYQPKLDLRTGSISGAEALLRWDHPKRGLLFPSTFIPVAEDCGLIVAIGRWVLREACVQARGWVDAGFPGISVAVNVSAIEFRSESFASDVFAILQDTGLAPGNLELELTESVFMRHLESAASILQSLRSAGVQIAVDDFGTGYSSLSYLRKLPVDTLKIDRSFVAQVVLGADEAAILTAVINMARSLRLQVIAEGVETREELEFLHAQDCAQAQGFYFSRPVPVSSFVRLLLQQADGQKLKGVQRKPSVRTSVAV